MKKYQALLGFTLVEMMITVAIVGILSAIAYPSYMTTVRKSNRADAKTELMDVAQRLQRCYTSFGRFDDPNNLDRCAMYEQLTTGTAVIPTRGKGLYNISMTQVVPATDFTLTATAVKSPQLADVEGCEAMTLTSLGVKGPIQVVGEPSHCW